MKLQLFEDCGLDSEKIDWGLVDKHLDWWTEASKEEKTTIAYYKRNEEGEIVADTGRITEAGPPFFKHCSAECVE